MYGSATYADVEKRLCLVSASSKTSQFYGYCLPSWYPPFSADSGRTHSPTRHTAGKHGQPWATTFHTIRKQAFSCLEDTETHGRIASDVGGDSGGFTRVTREGVAEHTVVLGRFGVVAGTATVHQAGGEAVLCREYSLDWESERQGRGGAPRGGRACCCCMGVSMLKPNL